MVTCLARAVILAAAAVQLACASSGDRSLAFNRCIAECARKGCPAEGLAVELQLLGWTCASNCKYECMHRVTGDDVAHRRPVQQFFGKWPFLRVLGIQEPVSVVASLGNGFFVLRGFRAFLRDTPSAYPLRTPWTLYGCVAVLVWVASSVFHTRDVVLTERADYFLAMAGVILSTLCCACRICGPRAFVPLLVLLGSFLAYHIWYLCVFLPTFDYGYNMKVNVALGLLHGAAWVGWWLCVRNRVPHAWKVFVSTVGILGTLPLELLDFPPIMGLLDAHALWHISTIPFSYLFWEFIRDDGLFLVNSTPHTHTGKTSDKAKAE